MSRFDASTIWNFVNEHRTDEGTENRSDAMDDDSEQSFAINKGIKCNSNDSSGESIAWSSLAAQTFFVPMHYELNYRYPLIVWLHSDGFNENQVNHVVPHISTRNYLATGIRAPRANDASGHRFSWGDSEAALESAEQSILTAIDRTAGQFSLHAERIVIAGYQAGGTTALRMAMRHPELFAAAVSLGGCFPMLRAAEIDMERLRSRRLPMLWQRSIHSPSYCEHQLIDDAELAMAAKARLEIRQYRNEDEMNTGVLTDLDRWIMEHVVGSQPFAKLQPWDTSPTLFSDN